MRQQVYQFPFIDVRRELNKKSAGQYSSYALYLKLLQDKNWKYMRMYAFVQEVIYDRTN